MSKIKVTLEVDPGKLFDILHEMKGDCSQLGIRLSGLLMTGECSWIERAALEAVYGVSIGKVEKIDAKDQGVADVHG